MKVAQKIPDAIHVYIDLLPESIQEALYQDEKFCSSEKIYQERGVIYRDFPTIPWKILFKGLRDFFKTQEIQILPLKNITVKIEPTEEGAASITTVKDGEKKIIFVPYFQFLSPDSNIRLKWLKTLLSNAGSTGPDLEKWISILQNAPSDKTMQDFISEFEAAFSPMLAKIEHRLVNGTQTPEQALLPEMELSYFLCYGPKPDKNETWENYYSQKLGPYLNTLVKKDWKGAFILISALDLIEELRPTKFFSHISDNEIYEFISSKNLSKNPISRIAVLDVCLSRFTKDERFKELFENYFSSFLNDEFIGKDYELFCLFQKLETYIFQKLSLKSSLSGCPSFWLKLISWGHSGHLLNLLTKFDIEKEKWARWFDTDATQEDMILTALYAGEYPLWLSGTEHERAHKGFIFGRLINLIGSHEESLQGLNITSRIIERIQALESQGVILERFLPTPLLPSKSPCPDLPSNILEEKDSMYTAIKDKFTEAPENATALAAHVSKFYGLSQEIIDLIELYVTDLEFPLDKDVRLPFWNTVIFAAFISVSTSNVQLMECVLKKLRLIIGNENNSGDDIRRLVGVAILCTRTLQEENQQAKTLNELLSFCGWRVSKGEAAQALYDILVAFKHCLPIEKWFYSKALSTAQLAASAN